MASDTLRTGLDAPERIKAVTLIKSNSRVGRPKAGEAEDIEPRILARTWDLFSSGGYNAVTYDALARLEHMSKQTIYARYATKEALFHAAAERRIRSWGEETRQEIEATAAERVSGFVKASLRIMLTPDSVALGQLIRGHGDSFPELKALIRRLWSEGAKRLAAHLQSGRPALESEQAQVIARCIMDLVLGHTSAFYGDIPQGEARDAYLEEWTPRLVEMALRMLGPVR